MSALTHFDAKGEAHMVDVGAKSETRRIAVAKGTIHMAPATLRSLRAERQKKAMLSAWRALLPSWRASGRQI